MAKVAGFDEILSIVTINEVDFGTATRRRRWKCMWRSVTIGCRDNRVSVVVEAAVSNFEGIAIKGLKVEVFSYRRLM
jgi:hypothetical protein